MADLLLDWLNTARTGLNQRGYSVKVQVTEGQNSTSVDIDGSKFCGTICHWPPNLFEFQFNSFETGDVVLLETVNLENLKDISDYVEMVLLKVESANRGQ